MISSTFHPSGIRSIRCLIAVVVCSIATSGRSAEFDDFVNPLLAKKCLKCHGGEEVNGEVNFKQVATAKQLLEQPELIGAMIDAIEANNMPPEDEPALADQDRAMLLATLKQMLRELAASTSEQRTPIRRLNRYQYNNAVKDLFQLNRDVFALPEKLMTRHSDYLRGDSGKMPDRVNVESRSLDPIAGLEGVKPFPKDLRAAHGFDNQANQLTLSPLLLDAFLRLSVSIVESPDFNEQNVGIWDEFFREPAQDADPKTEIRRRLEPFLRLAFRGVVDESTLKRYVAYASASLHRGMPFADCMKKTASAALSSPLFLYRSSPEDGKTDQSELASNLSFFLWNSGPDQQLLDLAESGELGKPEALGKTIDRMLADPKVERFLDTFPAQWMQLENVLAATPDPQQNRYFRLDDNHPASLQMVLEPLLLFDMVFVEDRPITELITPQFTYRSEFLKTWYTSDLKPPVVDTQTIVEENRRHDEERKRLQATIRTHQSKLDALRTSVRNKLLAAHEKEPREQPPLDLKPYAAWEFDGDLKEAVNGLDLQAHGEIEFVDGMVVLNGAYLLSKNLPIDLQAKALEVWCKVPDLNQRGGGVMGIQGPGDFFDTIVLGERQGQHWISGSNGFSRTNDFPESTPETKSNEMLHLVMVYTEDGTTTLYRDGQPYGKSYRKGQATFPKDQTSVIFGLRHLPPGGNKYLNVSIDKARLYNRALTAEEVAASASGNNFFVTEQELLGALSRQERSKHDELATTLATMKSSLSRVPLAKDPAKARQNAQQWFDDEIRRKLHSRTFERVAVDDPRYGGVITNAAMLSMTSGPKRTHPIARGAWIIEVILNDPPPPPPNDVPPLDEDASDKNQTIREKFAAHRENPSCAGCHSRLDPLGFALENFDITGRWRDRYDNGRDVDAMGTLMRRHEFANVVQFKQALVKERRRFAKAFTAHLLRYALSRELTAADSIAVEDIVAQTEQDNFKLRSILRTVILHKAFGGK